MERFSETLMDYFQDPRRRGAMEQPHAVGRGDLGGRPPRVVIYLRFEGEKVAAATFEAAGCGVTIACAALVAELVEGRTRDDCTRLTPQQLAQELDGLPPDKAYCAEVVVLTLRAALQDDAKVPGEETN